MAFGQIVLGPPASGKTTYCQSISQAYEQIQRPCCIINLDPANDAVPYTATIDISDLISIGDVMEEFDLGPNGALVYCIEYLEKNLDWLVEKLEPLVASNKYLLFDCPGQVELFTHHSGLKNIIAQLEKTLKLRLCAVHLVDSHHCTDPAKYISVLLLALETMINVELPHVNVLSKIDLVERYGKLPFNLEFFTEVQDLEYLLHHLNESSSPKFVKLNEALVQLIQDYSLVGFYTLCIDDKESLVNLIRVIDKANGYVFGADKAGNESIFQTAMKMGLFEGVQDVQEKYMGADTVIEKFEDSRATSLVADPWGQMGIWAVAVAHTLPVDAQGRAGAGLLASKRDTVAREYTLDAEYILGDQNSPVADSVAHTAVVLEFVLVAPDNSPLGSALSAD